jgi:hypothetical protein
MEVIVILRMTRARRETVQEPAPQPRVFDELEHDLGVTFRPQHPRSPDPQLRTYYVASVPDADRAEEVRARLDGHRRVASVYVKPPDEPPAP